MGMPEVRKGLREPQPITFLLQLHFAPASCRKKSARNRAIPPLRKTREAVWAGTRGAGKNAHSISGAHEFRSGEFEARSDCRSRRARAPPGKTPLYEDYISPRNHVHSFRFRSCADLDREVLGWLQVAYRVGQQLHLANRMRSPKSA